MRYHDLIKQAKEFDISIQSAVRMRIRYLLEVIDAWDIYIDGQNNIMPPLTAIDALDEIIAFRNQELRQKKGSNLKDITDEMIQSAREYPIDQVIEFSKGWAVAFCHKDTKPSLSWNKKNNTAHCFPCCRSFNSLDVLIERDNKSFIEAVKELC